MKRAAFVVLVLLMSGCLEDPITEEAIEKGNPNICSKLEKEGQQTDCVIKVAKSEQDADICNKYFNHDIGYRQRCITEVAREVGSTELCDEAGEFIGGELHKWSCYRDVGIKNEDPGICEMIENMEDKSECFATLGNRGADESLCDKASDANPGYRTVDSCYKSVAEKKNDSSLCQNVKDKNARDECLLEIATKTKNPHPCLKMSDEYGHYCTAKITGNGEECELSGRRVYPCLVEAATTSKNSRVCADIPHPYYKRQCYEKVAKETGNENLCEKISEDRRFSCTLAAARTAKNPEVCKYVEEKNKDYCFKEMAYEVKDKKLCDNVKDEKEKQYCEDRITRSVTTTTIAYENKSIIGKAKEKASDYAADIIGDILGF